jgi:hypothetical protein
MTEYCGLLPESVGAARTPTLGRGRAFVLGKQNARVSNSGIDRRIIWKPLEARIYEGEVE